MTIQKTYSDARAHLAELFSKAVDDRETVIIKRRGSKDVALIAADELAGLQETAHLLRSPKNAARLLKALERALARTLEPEPLEKLRREMRLGRER